MIIGITGHRSCPNTETFLTHFGDFIHEHYVDAGDISFMIGGAVGFDMMVGEWCCMKQIPFELILPFPASIHSHLWTKGDKDRLLELMRKARKVTILNQTYNPCFYHMRNKMIVDMADELVCYWDGRESGGTFKTVRYAKGKRKQILNCWGR